MNQIIGDKELGNENKTNLHSMYSTFSTLCISKVEKIEVTLSPCGGRYLCAKTTHINNSSS
jgi:hypothetical protein